MVFIIISQFLNVNIISRFTVCLQSYSHLIRFNFNILRNDLEMFIFLNCFNFKRLSHLHPYVYIMSPFNFDIIKLLWQLRKLKGFSHTVYFNFMVWWKKMFSYQFIKIFKMELICTIYPNINISMCLQWYLCSPWLKYNIPDFNSSLKSYKLLICHIIHLVLKVRHDKNENIFL